MEKPLLVRRRDFIASVSESINAADLPPVIILPIFEDLVRELTRLINEETNRESMKYNASLQEENNTDG